jgi:transcriptional antiterminator RfaH
MIYWGIAQCQSQREAIAADHLERRGFKCYLPRIKITVHHANHAVRRTVPLFPGYLFIRITPTHWYQILSTVGVIRLLRNGDAEPSRIEDKIVEKIQAREIRGIVKLPKRLQPGDKVRILRGTFRDFIGIYDGMSGKERERVLLELLGRKVPIEISPDDLALLGAAP